MQGIKEFIQWDAESLDITNLPKNEISYGSIKVSQDKIGRDIGIPIITYRGEKDKPVLGLGAAIHGNELNGIPVVHQIFEEIRDYDTVQGTLIGVPIINIPGYMANQRKFTDGTDLNRIMPGKKRGKPSQEYAYNFFHRIVTKFDYMMDFHTASFGRINSHYIRANLLFPEILEFAKLQNSQIILHTRRPSGSLRQAATDHDIPTITIELGNPHMFQEEMINDAIIGIKNIMSYIGMIDEEITVSNIDPTFCKHSYWMRVREGGILKVYPKLVTKLEKNQVVGKLNDVFGRESRIYRTSEEGIVIGKNINPVVSSGGRILHLGILGGPSELDIDDIMFDDDFYDDEVE